MARGNCYSTLNTSYGFYHLLFTTALGETYYYYPTLKIRKLRHREINLFKITKLWYVTYYKTPSIVIRHAIILFTTNEERVLLKIRSILISELPNMKTNFCGFMFQ